jgi:hypothetical protein
MAMSSPRSSGATWAPLLLSIRESVTQPRGRAGPSNALTLRTAAVLGPDIGPRPARSSSRTADVGGFWIIWTMAYGVISWWTARASMYFAPQLIREALHTQIGVPELLVLRPQPCRWSRIDPLAAAHHARLGGDHGGAAYMDRGFERARLWPKTGLADRRRRAARVLPRCGRTEQPRHRRPRRRTDVTQAGRTRRRPRVSPA